MTLPTKVQPNYVDGTVDEIEAQSIPEFAASSSKNWLTKGSHIELRRGYAVKGNRISGTDKVTGIHVGQTGQGTQVLFWSYLRKLLYFDEGAATPTGTEIGSNLFPTAASGEDMSFASYFPLAGAQVWISSPNSGLYKAMVNSGRTGSGKVAPAAKDNYTSGTNYRGKIKIQLNRMFLWGRNEDKTGLYLSWIDSRTTTAVSAESFGTGDGTTKTFSATLAAVTGIRTCYGVSVTDGTETFTDNYDGTLTGSAGGTGTANYSSGAVSVTFNTAPTNLQAITTSYNWENSQTDGIADFGFSGTRLAGEGAVFRQDDQGSPIQNVLSYKDSEYCFHKLLAYALTLTNTDTNATNLIYRIRVGIPNMRAAVATGEGIYYVDDTDEANPRIRLMHFDSGSQEVVPIPVSNRIKLSSYRFNMAAAIEWDDYILIACRRSTSSYNDRILAYNKMWKSWDVLDYFATCFAIYNGVLVAGDSLSPNALELFSGYDDDGALVDNFWIGKLKDLQIRELKKSRELWLRGLIQRDQLLDVYLSVDNGDFVFVGTVDGDGDYVDRGQAVSIGSLMIGSGEVGGGGAGAVAYPYFRKIKIRNLIDKFERIKIKFIATNIGYVSVSEEEYHDVTRHGQRIPAKYATNNS